MLTVSSDDAGIDKAVDALRAGQIIAYPTETVYGLGVDPENETAINALYDVKGRELEKKLILIVSSVDQLQRYVDDLSETEEKLVRSFWPGPLSLLFSPSAGTPDYLLGDTGKICIRQTSDSVAASICESFGRAIVSTSANLSGNDPAKNAGSVEVPGVVVCIDGGESGDVSPSTIYDTETGAVIRHGEISAEMIEKALVT